MRPKTKIIIATLTPLKTLLIRPLESETRNSISRVKLTL
jgi:hypothetical protein